MRFDERPGHARTIAVCPCKPTLAAFSLGEARVHAFDVVPFEDRTLHATRHLEICRPPGEVTAKTQDKET